MTDKPKDTLPNTKVADIALKFGELVKGKAYDLGTFKSLIKKLLTEANDEDREDLANHILNYLKEELTFYINLFRGISKKFDLDDIYFKRLTLAQMDDLYLAIGTEFKIALDAKLHEHMNIKNDLINDDTPSWKACRMLLGDYLELIVRLQEFMGIKTEDALHQLLHDFNGINTYPILYMGEASDNRAAADDLESDPEDEKYAEMSYEYAHLIGHAFRHISACHELLLKRVFPQHEMPQEEMDFAQFIEVTANAQAFRFNRIESPHTNMSIKLTVEEGLNPTLKASPDALHVIFLNIFKNAAKIIQERKISPDLQEIELHLFEREGVLFLHYNDQIGGLDLRGLFNSAVDETKRRTHNKAGEILPTPLRVIKGGAFHAADTFTMRDLCELIFLDRVHARNGGSGLGMAEAKRLLAENGMMLSTALNRENGTQFVFAFPHSPKSPQELESLMRHVESELDRKESLKLGLAA